MKTSKHSFLLWAFLLGIVATTAAVAADETPAEARIVEVTPRNFTNFIGGEQYLKDIEIVFADARSVAVNESKTPRFALTSLSVGFPGSISSTNPQYLVGSIVTSTDGSKGLITVTGAGSFGNENGISMSATNNYLMLKITQGLFDVTGSDGVVRPSEEICMRFTFDNMPKINPIGITDYCTVTPDQLSVLTFPEGLDSYSPQTASGYQLWSFPNGIGGARKIVGRYKIAKGADGRLVATYEGNYQNSSEEGVTYSGSISELPAGDYYLAPSVKMMFKNDDGKVQQAAWITPVTLVKPSTTDFSIGVAGDIDATAYTGKTMPEFAASIDGELSVTFGNTVTATIDNTPYELIANHGNLTFTHADNLALTEKYLNKGAFTMKVTAPAGAVNVLTPDGENIVNSKEINFSLTVKIENTLSPAEVAGLYYAKYLRGTAGEEKIDTGGWPVNVVWDEELGMMAFVNLLGGSAAADDDDPMQLQQALYAYIVPEQFQIHFPTQPVAYDTAYYSFTTANNASADDMVTADVDIMGNISIDGWCLKNEEGAVYLGNTSMMLVKDDGITPDTPEFSAAVKYTDGKFVIAGSATMPQSTVTELRVYQNDELVYVGRDVQAGDTSEFVINAEPANGTSYSYYAVAVNCGHSSSPTEVVTIDYDPLDITDVGGKYYVTQFSGTTKNFNEDVVVFADEAGEFAYTGFNMELVINSEVSNGRCAVTLKGLRERFVPKGTLDLVTHTITFEMADAYSVAYRALDPQTNTMGTYTATFNLIKNDNKTGDTTQNHRLTGSIDNQGVLTIGAWELVIPGELYNDVYTSCSGITAVRNHGVVPQVPQITATIDGEDEVFTVSGSVEVPSTDVSGAALATDCGGHNITVYRIDAEGNTEVVLAGENLNSGEVVTFTDDVTAGVYTYKAYDEYLGVANPEAAEATVDTSLSSILDVEAQSAAGDVYDLRGVMVRSKASTHDIRSLPAGIYIVNGRKVVITK